MWDFRNSLAVSMVDMLAKVMSEALPEELMDTLQHVQIASLEDGTKKGKETMAELFKKNLKNSKEK